MKKFHFSTFIILIFSLFQDSVGLDCSQIPDSDIQTTYTIYLPSYNQGYPVFIPNGFNCTYQIKTLPNLYAHLTVTNGLTGSGTSIVVDDNRGKITTVTSQSPTSLDFYIFPNSTTSVSITSINPTTYSKFQLEIKYENMLIPYNQSMQGYGYMNYWKLAQLQIPNYYHPVTYYGKEPFHLSLANSYYPSTSFDNYFVIDGTLATPLSTHRLSEFLNFSFITTSNIITIFGLDNKKIDAAIILNPISESAKFDELGATGSTQNAQKINILAKSSKKANEVLAMGTTSQITINSVYFSEYTSNCTAKIVTGPPNAYSQVVLDLVNDGYLQPFPIKWKYFTVIVENCSVSFSVWSPN